MNTKVLLATLAAAVAAFIFGWVLFGILLADFYKAKTPMFEGLIKEPPNVLMIFLSNLVNAFLISYIFNRWAGIRTAVEGTQAGFIIVGIMTLGYDLMVYATMNLLTPIVMVVDVVGGAVFGAVMGSVAGLVPGFRRRIAST